MYLHKSLTEILLIKRNIHSNAIFFRIGLFRSYQSIQSHGVKFEVIANLPKAQLISGFRRAFLQSITFISRLMHSII